MAEGSLDAPTRHPIPWQDEDFYDREKIEAEMDRVFDICHGCRRCFNLCDSFPRLFDMIDESETGELDSVDKKDYRKVVDACTLCDMCFMTKCPYVPPHEFNLDFPHLMLRHRAADYKEGKVGLAEKQLTRTDRNGKIGGAMAALCNWAGKTENVFTRSVLQACAGVHKEAHLPDFHSRTFEDRAKKNPPEVNTDAPAHGRKAVIYATCFTNYNQPEIGEAALKVLAHNGVETEVVYPVCCGMPQLEQGNVEEVADRARQVAKAMKPWIGKGYDVISTTPSCTLMMKFEWPLILPDDDDVKRLSEHTRELSEYIVDISKNEGLNDSMKAPEGSIVVHHACHARAQNMGAKVRDMLNLIPDAKVNFIERCSGHGGSWGVMKENFDVAIKVGRPVARQAVGAEPEYVVSECPLARDHIIQGMERQKDADEVVKNVKSAHHPIQIMAAAYGLDEK